MTIHKKLMDARIALHEMPLSKSGWNDFSKYAYFELGDFLPQTLKLFHAANMCGVVTFEAETARLTLTDLDDGTEVVITSPMAEAALKGAHAIQNLGAVQTYMRRYLWVTAMEVIENDFLDHVHDKNKPSHPASSKPKAERIEPTPAPAAKPAAKPAEKTTAGKPGEWQITLTEQEGSDWAQAVIEATEIAFQICQSQADVQNIFKVNRLHFDRLKNEAPVKYDELLLRFKAVKEKFPAQE